MLTEILKYLAVTSERCPRLECDGMTRVVAYVLKKNKIPHTIKCGALMQNGQCVIAPHYWAELSDGKIVDFRARMWAGNLPTVPHGMFDLKDFPSFKYPGDVVRMNVSAFIFNILTGESKLPDEIDCAKEAAYRPQ